MLYLPLVEALARRFAGADEGLEDLVQVGAIGLMKAVQRFDSGRGAPFAAFAVPTIVGELRHHVRDRAWPVRISRRVRALDAELTRPTRDLRTRLDRNPTAAELAGLVGVSERRVVRALESREARSVVPLQDDLPQTAVEDPLAATEDRLVVEAGLRVLDPRERTIVRRYFLAGRSQSEIARELGISQIHVSRLLRRALDRMADQIAPAAGPTA